MRIVGGQFKGRKLIKPSKGMIRPTADRTREAIFNILGNKVAGAHVLDLFAGTGALGIEALSRGAKSAVFVENDKYAISIIKGNISACKLEEKTDVVKLNALKNLNCLKFYALPFDIIFIDPPYRQGMLAPVLDFLTQRGAVMQDTTVIVEHAVGEPLPKKKGLLQLYDQRKYGNSLVSFLSNML